MTRFAVAILVLACWAGPVLGAGYDELNFGIAARNRGLWDQAIDHLNKALAAGDLIPDQQYVAHLDRGQAYSAKGNLDDAVADFTACAELRADDPQPRFLRASIFIATGEVDAARKDVEAVLAANSEDDEAHLIRARTYEIQGNAEEELKDMQDVLARNPKSVGISYDTGIAAFLAGRGQDAVALFEPMSGDQTRYLYGWLWQAMAVLQQGKPVTADVSSRFDRATWPGPVINFYQGHASEDDVNAAAGKGDARALKGQVCEANFYLAEWRKLHGEAAAARPLFQKAASDCPRVFIEWYAAQAELNHAP
jgi:lipoprotein NlpI